MTHGRQDERAPKGIPIHALNEKFEEMGNFTHVAKHFGVKQENVARRLKAFWAKGLGEKNTDGNIPNYTPGAGRVVKSVSKQMDADGDVKAYSVREAAVEEEENFTHPLDKVKRVSTLRGADGRISAQWTITTDQEGKQREAFDQILEQFKEEVPRQKPRPRTSAKALSTSLHNNYVLSDAHIGSLAWKPESGASWDLAIAEEMLIKAMAAMIDQSALADSCTVALLGDWMHYDKFEAVTTLSGNILDGDGRQPKMNKVAVRVARNVINQALEKHSVVEVLVAEGNHDIIAANWLRELFIILYENEPRVQVIDDPRPYYASLKGDTFHGWHHGHLKGAPNIKSAENLIALFADEYRELWGRAKKVYINTGHFHFATESEVRGGRVLQHPTLTTRDSWAARRGYGSIREARASTYHLKYGLTGTVNISPEMLE
jgi:hypothetical protein